MIATRRASPWHTNRRLVVGVLALALGVAVLVISLVGLGRTVGALTRLAPAAAEQLSFDPPAEQLAARGLPITTVVPVTAPPASRPNDLRVPEPALPPATAVTTARPDASAASVESTLVVAGSVGGAGGFKASGSGGIGGDGMGGAGRGAAAGGAALATVPCGPTTCSADQRCCNPSCGICAAPGESCSPQLCGVASVASSVMCGTNTCNVGQVCCNASCGICTAPGQSCRQEACSNAARAPTNFMCGAAQCNDGQICCNPSCGTCVAPGESCSHEICR